MKREMGWGKDGRRKRIWMVWQTKKEDNYHEKEMMDEASEGVKGREREKNSENLEKREGRRGTWERKYIYVYKRKRKQD
jgi:hypothetical protein